MNRRTLGCLAGSLLLLCTAGCVREEVSGTTRTFTYELWVPASILVGGIVAAVAGWFLRQRGSWGWILLIGGPIAAIFFAPSMFRDRTVLTDERLQVTTGIWGMTAAHDVAFADLTMIRQIAEESRGRRGRRRTNYYLVCERKDGTSAKLPLGNNLVEAAATPFMEAATARGIPYQDDTGVPDEG
jgi:MFS family permease